MNENPFEIIFYVEDVAKSCIFYTRLLECKPSASWPTFAVYPLKAGGKFALWAKADVVPAIPSQGTSGELAFQVESNAMVDAIHKRWSDEKTTIAQPPTVMDFGYTFTALDPDGNRVRVFSLLAK